MVSLVSLPFSLGIAISSGAPPVAGLISAIIAGLIYPFLGGSFVTISGPAAGLAPVLFVSMAALGGAGEPYAGYPRLLAVICMAGCVQIVLSRLKVARYSAWFSPTVVEAMLASIGLLIIAKELPDLIGNKFAAHEFWPILAELPSQIMKMNPSVFIVGCLCLALTIGLSVARNRWTKIIPPPLTVVVIGLGLGVVFGIDGKHLIEIPDKLKDGMKLPDFQSLFADHTLRRHRQDRPLQAQKLARPHASGDGDFKYPVERCRRFDNHPRRSEKHDLHHHRGKNPVGQLL
jgi:carbonic anhydrase